VQVNRLMAAINTTKHRSSSMSQTHLPEGNHLLGALPSDVLQRWSPYLQKVAMPVGMVLRDACRAQSHAYFPTSALVSIQNETRAGSSFEIAMVGREGLVGTMQLMGGASTLSSAVVSCAGHGFSLPMSALMAEFQRPGSAATPLLLRYIQASITQMSQTAVCSRHHSLEQHLCRWLLMALDRLPGNELAITQELISSRLGVRREGVTQAALKLQLNGLISYGRGLIKVLDREGLAKLSCECYAVVKKEYDRLLPVAPSIDHLWTMLPAMAGHSSPAWTPKSPAPLSRGHRPPVKAPSRTPMGAWPLGQAWAGARTQADTACGTP